MARDLDQRFDEAHLLQEPPEDSREKPGEDHDRDERATHAGNHFVRESAPVAAQNESDGECDEEDRPEAALVRGARKTEPADSREKDRERREDADVSAEEAKRLGFRRVIAGMEP